MMKAVTLHDEEFIALNGGPHFKFTEAVSFMVRRYDQGEVDKYWSALTADGGEESQCGWLKDKYGLSWQITPTVLFTCITDKDPREGEAHHAGDDDDEEDRYRGD